MDELEEKRVFGKRGGVTPVYAVGDAGVVCALVSGGSVGEFGIVERCRGRDLAVGTRRGGEERVLAVATEADVLYTPLVESSDRSGVPPHHFQPLEFGPATAVSIHDGVLFAADDSGGVSRLSLRGLDIGGADANADTDTSTPTDTGTTMDGVAPTEWTPLEYDGAAEPGSVRALDGPLVATDRGVFRYWRGRLTHAGLEDVRDVSASGTPLTATDAGLYKLGNGWMRVLEGSFDGVWADPASRPGALERAHASDEGGLWSTAPKTEGWNRVTADTAPDSIGSVAYGEAVFAGTTDGRLCIQQQAGETAAGSSPAAAGEWRCHHLGLEAVRAVTVVGAGGHEPDV